MSEKTTKTHTEVAHLLRAIERGIVYDRLPAPTSFYVDQEFGYAKLRFEAAEDVHAWAPLVGATIVTGKHVFDSESERPWHEVGTEQGGKPGELVGWQLNMWASVHGLPPVPEPELVDKVDQEWVAESDPEPEAEAEADQEWLFTFGAGQQYDGKFVRIVGTYETARSTMNVVFGHAWCAQYDWKRFDEEGLPARVTELPQAEWPAHAEPVGPKPCVACKHVDEHWHDLGCEAVNGFGQRCGCTHVPAGR